MLTLITAIFGAISAIVLCIWVSICCLRINARTVSAHLIVQNTPQKNEKIIGTDERRPTLEDNEKDVQIQPIPELLERVSEKSVVNVIKIDLHSQGEPLDTTIVRERPPSI